MADGAVERTYDELLVLLVLDGDRPAAERLAARWHRRFLRTARRLIGEADAAEEIAQEAWCAVISGLPRLTDPARFPAWSFTILRRTCADAIKRKARERRMRTATAPTPSENGRGEALTALDQAFATLTPDHRLAAILFFGEGMTLAEIAAATRVPIGTAKSRIFHARRQLKAVLEGDEQ